MNKDIKTKKKQFKVIASDQEVTGSGQGIAVLGLLFFLLL